VSKSKDLILGVIYRHPVSTIEHIDLFSNNLNEIFHKFSLEKSEFYAVGNYNVDLLQIRS